MSVVNPTVDLIADTIGDNVERAAACSHRPENVTRLWQDANARYLMATEIARALGLPWEREPDPGQRSIWVDD